MADPDLERAVRTVVRRCLDVRDGDDVLVVVDPDRQALGHALLDHSREAGGDAALVVLPPNAARGTEPPKPVAEALAAADVFIAPCLPSLSHTTARKRASDAGARGATMPGVTESLLARLMSADFDVMARRCAAVAELLDDADEAHLSCVRGTDLHLDLSERRGIADDGDLTAPGAFGNLPCGEGFIAPAGGEGTIAASSLPGRGIVPGHASGLPRTGDEPVLIAVRDGALSGATGAGADEYLDQLDAHGPLGRNLAELGVGTNDRATLTGNILEDEKILGTAHVAFGASAAIGGTVTVPVHLDVVVLNPTLFIGSEQVLYQGNFLL